ASKTACTANGLPTPQMLTPVAPAACVWPLAQSARSSFDQRRTPPNPLQTTSANPRATAPFHSVERFAQRSLSVCARIIHLFQVFPQVARAVRRVGVPALEDGGMQSLGAIQHP